MIPNLISVFLYQQRLYLLLLQVAAAAVRRYRMKHNSFRHGLDYGLANQGFGRRISGSGGRFFTSPKRPERIVGTTHLPN